jgi:membrane associated rhomboid family serine protease
MSWQDRQYSYGQGSYEQGGGARSWLGGLPAPGKAIKWIMIVNVGMWILCLITGGMRSPIYNALLMNTDKVLHGQIWRLFTFTYLHDPLSLAHILFNMLGLYMLGMYLERALGPKRFFVFYTLGGFAAVTLYVILTLAGWLSSHAELVGASGNVLAVLGAAAVLYPSIQLILFVFPVPIRTAVVLFTLLYGFNLYSQGANAGGDACHLAGMAFGVAWGYGGRTWLDKWDSMRSGMRTRAVQSQQQRAVDLQAEVDRILAKVHDHGIQSLSEREKRILADATKEKQRQF